MLGLGPHWGALPTSWCQDPELHCTFLGKDSTSASRKTLKNINPSTSLLPYNPDSSHDTGDRPLAWAPGPTCPAPACLQHHPSLCPEPAPRGSVKALPQEKPPATAPCCSLRNILCLAAGCPRTTQCLQHEPVAWPLSRNLRGHTHLCTARHGPDTLRAQGPWVGQAPQCWLGDWTKHAQGPGPGGVQKAGAGSLCSSVASLC